MEHFRGKQKVRLLNFFLILKKYGKNTIYKILLKLLNLEKMEFLKF